MMPCGCDGGIRARLGNAPDGKLDFTPVLVIVGVYILASILTDPISTMAERAARRNRFREKFNPPDPNRDWLDE